MQRGLVGGSCFIDGPLCNDFHSCSVDVVRKKAANSHFKIKNLDDGTELVVDEWGEDGNMRRLRHVSSNRLYAMEGFAFRGAVHAEGGSWRE